MSAKSVAKAALEAELLLTLSKEGKVENTNTFAAASKVQFKNKENLVMNVVRSLTAAELVASELFSVQRVGLTADGKRWLSEGSPEAQVYAVLDKPTNKKDLAARSEIKALGKAFKQGLNELMKQRLVAMNRQTKNYERIGEMKGDIIREALGGDLSALGDSLAVLLRRRKMITTRKLTWYSVQKGPKFALKRRDVATDLSQELLQSGKWREVDFKKYLLTVEPKQEPSGAFHPLMKVRTEFRKILLEMGFSEMPTNNFIESSFWNFDTLFQPQQHPARDAHDTFFLKQPATCGPLNQDYMQRVKSMHEQGGSGSIGYRYNWSQDEAKKNILRTHTTAVSSRMLYLLAQQKEFTPKKYFSIDRVFRNETLDATHLAEFHQVEGLIADRGLSLSHLIGTIKTFFQRIGIDDVKFKPAYNPYTEPSMEIFGYSKELKKWIEIGNSGMFRPEMLAPMGLPEDVTVIAWGLSLERPTMIKYGYKNIRDLFGHKVDLELIYGNPLCRY